MRIGLVRDFTDTNHLVFYNLQEFEKAILEDPEVEPIVRGKYWIKIVSVLWKAWRHAGRFCGITGPYTIPDRRKYTFRFVALMGLSARRCGDFIFSGRKAAFLLDPTEPWATPRDVARFVDEVGITDLFVGDPDFIPPIVEHTSKCRVHFLVEGIDPDQYHPRPVEEKDIDVLEFGRKMPGYHDALVEGLARAGMRHEYGFIEGREDFVDHVGRARIVTCFPRTMTEQTTKVEFVSARYLQAMASKSLIVGKAPEILNELFGYEPVIPADLNDPVGQVKDILSRFRDYDDLIEQNYRMIIKAFTYKHRWEEVKRIISS